MEKVDWLYFQVNLVCLMIMAKLWRTVFYDYRSQKESRLLKYLSQKFKSFNSDDSTKNLYLMMLDVDDFKKINDSHNATVADLLKSADESMYQNKKSHKKEMQV